MHRFGLPRARFVVFAAAIALLISAVSAGSVIAGSGDPAYLANLVFGKHLDNPIKDVSFAENGGPASTFAAEKAALLAYPADTVSSDAAFNSQGTFRSFQQTGRSVGRWTAIGPTQRAVYPAVLDQFLFDSAPYVASGRVTAMAIAPNCDKEDCRLYMGAAGGGIWVTDNALASSNAGWRYVSGALGSNAVGSVLIDPRDRNANTVYVGTGEPNASGDSEAGVGIYKSTNGGRTWALVPGSDIFTQRSIGQMALDSAGNLLVPIASGVRGIASTGGASSSGTAAHPLVPRGLYRQTGSTFTQIWVAPAPTRGSTTVEIDPTHSATIYVNAFQQGIWRSTNNGATFSQIFVAQDPTVAGSAIDRSEFDVVTLKSGATRMYVGEGQGGGAGHQSNFWRSDNADAVATFTMMGGAQTNNYCTSQCWYDNYVVAVNGSPDVVYLGGSFDYNQKFDGSSNARAVLLSTDGGATWSDLTLDGDPNHSEGMHPDQHALVTVPGKPLEFIAGSDGGVIRSDGKFADISFKCDERSLDPAHTAYCKSLLKRVPNQLIVMNDGLNTLQFQSLSFSSQRPTKLLQGGTQDNGTFQYNGSAAVWPQIIYGDGGQSGFNVSNDKLRFNTFTGQGNDANFQNGDPTKWVIIGGPIAASPEGSLFYPPIIADPNPATAGSIFQGSFSVWRTQDWGGDQAYLEANCPEFTASAADPTCGDFVPIGDGPTTRLTSSFWGTRAGGAVSWIARDPSNTGTMWAATTTGRLFVTDNANAQANLVHWTRLDNFALNSPGRFPTSIQVDPANPNRAWVSYSGYTINTPATPGHIFEVVRTATTATWTDRTYDLADLPSTAVVRDDVTGDLYSGTDFGVFRLANDATSWTMTAGLPMAEVSGLSIVPSARVLYAATHGLGAWVFNLATRNGEEQRGEDR